MDLLNLCLTSTYFQYNGKHYRQLQGTAMASPVSVVIAEIVMQNIEEQALATWSSHGSPFHWRLSRVSKVAEQRLHECRSCWDIVHRGTSERSRTCRISVERSNRSVEMKIHGSIKKNNLPLFIVQGTTTKVNLQKGKDDIRTLFKKMAVLKLPN